MRIPSGKTILRWGARIGGGLAGFIGSAKFITSRFPAGKTLLGLPVKSDLASIGWDDIVDMGVAITTAGFAGKMVGGGKKGR